MISCGEARARMLDVARRGASEAVALEVESHIGRCAACEDERARWRLLGLLKEQATPVLGEAAERRILSHLLAEARNATAAPAAPRWRRPILAAVASGLTLAVVALVAARGLIRPGAPAKVLDGQRIEALAPGVVSFGGADVHYGARTRMTAYPSTRTLALLAGQADLEVKPGLPGRFRVTTPRFAVEVLGTRFVVTTDSVRTLRGRVLVLDLQNHELAALTAGENWTFRDASAPIPSPSAPPEPAKPAPPPPADGAARDVGASTAHPPSRAIPASQLLIRSRAALARGESRQARTLAQRALTAGPTDRESATGQLLLADALLVEKRSDEAIEAYRRVVQRWTRAPEAEVAQFAVAQLLLERGARAESEVALRDYLAWYPRGRFVREAREHLSLLQSRP